MARQLARILPGRPACALAAVIVVAASFAALPAGAACPNLRGDIAPGTLDTSTVPPTHRATGDGRVTIGDVVVALRATVHLQDVAWETPDPSCPTPGDVAPGTLDTSVVPARWYARGDDSLNLGDVIALLRASVGIAEIVEPLTYYRDTKAIIDDRCAGCHVAGGIGPFPLSAWEEVEPQVHPMHHAIEDGHMPPWPPDETCARYQHSRALSDAQRLLMLDWIAQGAARGNPYDEPPPPPPPPVITYDLTLTMPEPYSPDSTVSDDYRCFVLDWPPTSQVYVNAADVLPDVDPIVHHVIAFIADPSQVSQAEANDAADPGPGYTCFGGPGGNMRWLAAWAPGGSGGELPAGTGIRVAPGSKIVMQVHYNMDYAPSQPDRSSIRMRTATSVARPAGIALLPDTGFLIPAGDPDYTHSLAVTTSQLVLPIRGEIGGGLTDPVVVHDVAHHMHQLGAWGRIVVERAAGETCLLHIPDWHFHWQGAYRLEMPVTAAGSDRVRLTCNWDNSQENQPWIDGMQPTPVDVGWGEGSRDEMCLGIFLVTAP